ncbi:MAG: PKD domain-containing protein [Dehalococcoidia bacterium]|nr:PKD domain-containing protein [Dehalococcoidia bacterium]
MYGNPGEALDKIGSVKDTLIRIGLAAVAAAVLLLASSCTTVTNRLPIITSLEAEAEWIAPSGSLQMTCIASDPDGDELSYEWMTTGGDISGTGAVAIWTAPEEVGMYDITVVVDDGHGDKDTGFLTLIASDGPPPSIQELVVTAKEPKYLRTTSTGYKVGKTKEYYIECIASGTNGELVYEWSCNGGEISGAGSLITWTAPDTSGYVTVTAKVFDGAANWVRKNVVFEVVDCSPCEFG